MLHSPESVHVGLLTVGIEVSTVEWLWTGGEHSYQLRGQVVEFGARDHHIVELALGLGLSGRGGELSRQVKTAIYI